jgi:hypothetical protein
VSVSVICLADPERPVLEPAEPRPATRAGRVNVVGGGGGV